MSHPAERTRAPRALRPWTLCAVLSCAASTAAQGPRPYLSVDEAELTVSGAPAEFGRALAVDGATLVAGAPLHDPAGAAFVFTRDGTVWTEAHRLVAAGLTPDALFGSAVAVRGNRIVVGAPEEHTPPGPVHGAAYVFGWDGAAWVEEARLVSADGDDFDYFGDTVAIPEEDGDTLLIAASLDSGNGFITGAVYVFTHDGSAWSQAQKLTQSDPEPTDRFGFSMAAAPGSVLIGGRFTESVYEFVETGGGWVQQAQIVPSAPAAQATGFGFSVARRGGVALIGAPFADPVAGSGAAFVFTRQGATWVEAAKLAVPSAAGLQLGRSTAIDGELLIPSGTAAAHVFAPSGSGGWTDRLRIQNSSGITLTTVADEGRVFFGSLFENVPVHRIAPAPVTYCTGKLNSLGCPPSIGFSGLPSASASAGFAVVGANVRNQTTGTLLYSVGGRALVPFQGGVLCLASPVRRTPARSSGGVPPPTSNCSGAWRLDMNALSAGLAGGAPDPAASVCGAVVHCQWWGRDPNAVAGSALTDALQYVVGP